MKLIYTFVVVFLLNIVINVNADALVFETNNSTSNSILIDIKVKDVTRNNNVYEGIIDYDTKKVSNLSIIQDTGWEVYAKEIDNGLKFIAFNMNDVAINDTILFRLNMNYRDSVNISINDINAANGIDGITLYNVNYSYKYEVYVPPFVDNNVNNNPTPIIPEDVTNNIESEFEEEIEIPDKDEIVEEKEDIEEVEDEQYEVVVEQEKAPWWLSIIVIVAVVLVGVYLGCKEVPRGEN